VLGGHGVASHGVISGAGMFGGSMSAVLSHCHVICIRGIAWGGWTSKKVQRGTYRYPFSVEPEIFTCTRRLYRQGCTDSGKP